MTGNAVKPIVILVPGPLHRFGHASIGSLYKTMRVNNFNKLHIIAFATVARKWDFSPAKTLRNRRG